MRVGFQGQKPRDFNAKRNSAKLFTHFLTKNVYFNYKKNNPLFYRRAQRKGRKMNGDLQWRSITASAPAKVILHGEHSVVYGKLALAASIDLRTKVIFKLGNQKESVRVNLLDFSERPVEFGLDMLRSLPYDASSASEIDENLRNTLENIICNNVNTEEFSKHKEGLLALIYILVAFMQEAGLELRPLEIIVSSEIPMGAGLGSSAAFSVSMAAALVQLKNCLHKGQEKRPLEEDRVSICHWAFKSEKIIHGNPSGLDNSICTFGGIMSYITGQPLQPLASNSGSLRVLLINSCVSRNTKALVSQVRANRVNLMPKVAASILEAMDRVAKDAAETLGRLLNNNNNNSKNGSNHLIEDDQQLYRKLEVLRFGITPC